jgi:hypothetical protein
MTLGYYTAGFLICLIGQTPSYDTCRVYRSPNAYPTEEMCMENLARQYQFLPYTFDPDTTEVIDVKCIEWIAPGSPT